MSTLPTVIINSTISQVTSTSTESAVKAQIVQLGVWVHFAILVLGLLTNPMVLVVLSRKRIGSKYIFSLTMASIWRSLTCDGTTLMISLSFLALVIE